MIDDGGLQWFQQAGLEQQFNEIFKDEKNVSTTKTDASKDRVTEHTTKEVRSQ